MGMSAFIFLAIVYSLVLIVWTMIVVSGGKNIAMERRLWHEEIVEERSNYKKIKGVRVIFKDGSDHTFDKAKSYEKSIDFFEFRNEEGKLVAEVNARTVDVILFEREGDV